MHHTLRHGRSALVLLVAAFAPLLAVAEKAIINDTAQVYYKSGSQASFSGAAEYFTGEVKVDMLFPANADAHYGGAYVTFQPGSRTAWHSHPAGQHMVVTEGVGLTGTRDGKVITISKGDALWCPPGVDHWHGATATSAMTHLVVTGSTKAGNVVWKEQVAEPLYQNAQP